VKDSAGYLEQLYRDAGTATKCKTKQRAGRAKAAPLSNRLWIGKMNQDEKFTDSERNNQTTWPTARTSVPVPMDEAVWAICPSAQASYRSLVQKTSLRPYLSILGPKESCGQDVVPTQVCPVPE